MTWLIYALMTVAFWGVYGILLHAGVLGYEPKTDPTARYKAFLWVGIAYFLTAVIAPLVILMIQGGLNGLMSKGAMPPTWSLLAGVVGAAGAFCVLLAFGAKGTPAVVMSIIFAGAPIVNAVVAITIDNNWANIKLPFVLGIALAATGGCLVTLYKPAPAHGPPPATAPAESAASATNHTATPSITTDHADQG